MAGISGRQGTAGTYVYIAVYAFRRYSTYRVAPNGNAAAVVAAVAGRYEVDDIALREPGIEDVVTRLYRSGIPG